MDEASKQYTVFTMGNLGFFECECMPFRLCNAPATFQRLMQNWLGEMNLTYCLIYLDDVIVFVFFLFFVFETGGGALIMPAHCAQLLQGTQPEAKAHQV